MLKKAIESGRRKENKLPATVSSNSKSAGVFLNKAAGVINYGERRGEMNYIAIIISRADGAGQGGRRSLSFSHCAHSSFGKHKVQPEKTCRVKAAGDLVFVTKA